MRGSMLGSIRGLIVVGILLALPLSASAQEAAGLSVDPESGLLMDSGWQLVKAHCSACHSLKLVTDQRASRRGWLETIRWMQETQNLWQFDEQSETLILDYLAKYFPPAANQRRAPIPVHLMPDTDCGPDNG